MGYAQSAAGWVLDLPPNMFLFLGVRQCHLPCFQGNSFINQNMKKYLLIVYISFAVVNPWDKG